jgi:hypothetical protein
MREMDAGAQGTKLNRRYIILAKPPSEHTLIVFALFDFCYILFDVGGNLQVAEVVSRRSC